MAQRYSIRGGGLEPRARSCLYLSSAGGLPEGPPHPLNALLTCASEEDTYEWKWF